MISSGKITFYINCKGIKVDFPDINCISGLLQFSVKTSQKHFIFFLNHPVFAAIQL